MQIDEIKFNIIVGAYSFPGMILPFFTGMLMDRYGVIKNLVVYSTFTLIGVLITFYGTVILSYGLILTGSIIYGLGSCSLVSV